MSQCHLLGQWKFILFQNLLDPLCLLCVVKSCVLMTGWAECSLASQPHYPLRNADRFQYTESDRRCGTEWGWLARLG